MKLSISTTSGALWLVIATSGISSGSGIPETQQHCENNAVVAGWCDEKINPRLECAIFPQIGEYVCACFGDPAACPDDCVGGTDPYNKAHHWTQCKGIPVDQPNYVLKEHPKTGQSIACAENGVVASWCDEAIDTNLKCMMFPETDEYACQCNGDVYLSSSHCPDDCVGGVEPHKKTHFTTYCKGIPLDSPNYILKE